MFHNLGAPEILLILAVVVLLFGAKKLPELARGSGRALRIFKTEVKSLSDDDDKPDELGSTEVRDSTEVRNSTEADKKPEQI